jgi:diamine N-acetyltransferase
MNTEKDFSFQPLPLSEINLIQPLWDQLREHHLSKSPHFKERYTKLTFSDRIQALNDKDELFIDAARNKIDAKLVGYCLSSIKDQGGKREGEIDSILVVEKYRGFRIGDRLMERAIEWLNNKKADSIKIIVAAGNEEVFPFYGKYGFYHFSNVMLLKNKP